MWIRHCYNKVHVFLVFLIYLLNWRFFCFFFNLSEKRKLDLINSHFVFSISVLLLAFPSLFPAFPPWFPAFPSRFPAFPPYSPHSTHSHPYSLHSHSHSPHSPHFVPRFLVPVFTDRGFVSHGPDPKCVTENAFLLNWNKLDFYKLPPFPCLSSVLSKNISS